MDFTKKRITKDLELLKTNNYTYDYDESKNKLTFILNGPKDSLYEKGKFKIIITFPKEYPFKSPSIGFLTKIYHPNVEFNSGTICLDAITTNWTPSYDILNVVSVFIPQLLSYPNPDDPFNIEAANIFKNDREKFDSIVKFNIEKYCI